VAGTKHAVTRKIGDRHPLVSLFAMCLRMTINLVGHHWLCSGKVADVWNTRVTMMNLVTYCALPSYAQRAFRRSQIPAPARIVQYVHCYASMRGTTELCGPLSRTTLVQWLSILHRVMDDR
jgi:hypothetical protein